MVLTGLWLAASIQSFSWEILLAAIYAPGLFSEFSELSMAWSLK